jgi:hypothetical protein
MQNLFHGPYDSNESYSIKPKGNRDKIIKYSQKDSLQSKSTDEMSFSTWNSA